LSFWVTLPWGGNSLPTSSDRCLWPDNPLTLAYNQGDQVHEEKASYPEEGHSQEPGRCPSPNCRWGSPNAVGYVSIHVCAQYHVPRFIWLWGWLPLNAV